MLLLVGPYSFPGVLVRFPGQAVLGFPLTGRKGYKLVFQTKQGSKIDFKISKASCLGSQIRLNYGLSSLDRQDYDLHLADGQKLLVGISTWVPL